MKANSCTIGAAMMPDGKGGWMPVPPTLTEDEAIRYLRLDTLLKLKNPHKTLERYRAEGHLESCCISNTNFYTPELLQRFKAKMADLTSGRRHR